MDKLDRLVWADGFSFISYGVRIGVRINERAQLARVLSCLPPGWQRTTSTRVDRLYSVVAGGEGSRPNLKLLNLVYANANRLARTSSFDDALDALESDLQLFVAEEAPRRLFVHAGVVAWKGKAALIPGRSFSGKTSLVAELVKRGATYYSDEYAVLDAEGHVHNYARPLSIRENGQLAKPTRLDARASAVARQHDADIAGVEPTAVALTEQLRAARDLK